MSDLAFVLIAVFTAAFLGTFLALAVGLHLHIFGCHRRPNDEGYPAPPRRPEGL